MTNLAPRIIDPTEGGDPMTKLSSRLTITLTVLALLTLATIVTVTLILVGEHDLAHQIARSSWSIIATLVRSSWS